MTVSAWIEHSISPGGDDRGAATGRCTFAGTTGPNLKLPMRVFHVNWVPLAEKYSWVYQKVASSTGSMVMAL